jgi:predicted HAD superfamily Cof-like phosphohydrolase
MWPSGHRLRDSFTTDQMRSYAAAALAQREPMTHEQISGIYFKASTHLEFARAIERAHGITKDTP